MMVTSVLFYSFQGQATALSPDRQVVLMIKIYSTLQIGSFHTNYCEDFWVTAPIRSNEILIAVMDGCTMGQESAFSSMLLAKCLRNIAKELYYADFRVQDTAPLKEVLSKVCQKLFHQIRQLKNQLSLDTEELLSTLILGVINTKKYQAELFIIGDGLVCSDGQIFAYEQDNKPDYLAYHLGDSFEKWYGTHTQKLSVKDFRDLAISTDGIYTFRNFKVPHEQKSEREIIDFLLINSMLSEHKNALDRKLRIIQEQWQHEVTDDLAIVRLIKQ